MPRASRHYLPGYVWYLTHRCHRKQFLLKFLKGRCTWIDWFYAARQRFGLCVLDYNVTNNHVHLIVRDRGCGEIARSIQLAVAAAVPGCRCLETNSVSLRLQLVAPGARCRPRLCAAGGDIPRVFR